jgi:hypothetical protein
MELADLQAAIPGFIDKGHPEKIKILAWYLHAHKNLTSFQPADIRRCYDGLHFPLPSSFSGYFKNLDSSKEFLKHASRYRLSAMPRGFGRAPCRQGPHRHDHRAACNAAPILPSARIWMRPSSATSIVIGLGDSCLILPGNLRQVAQL